MKTQLDEKQELIHAIEVMSASEIQKLKVFVAGMEAGKAVVENSHTTAPDNSSQSRLK